MWFRRDLRLQDHPAPAAAADAGRVVALFVLDDALRRPSGAPRLAFLYRSLRDLDARLRQNGGELVLRRGKPETSFPPSPGMPAPPACTSAQTSDPTGLAR